MKNRMTTLRRNATSLRRYFSGAHRIKTFPRHLFYLSTVCALLHFADTSHAQNYPADLAELSLEKFLNLEITPDTRDLNSSFAAGLYTVRLQFSQNSLNEIRSSSAKLPLRQVLGSYPIAPVRMLISYKIFEFRYNIIDNFAIGMRLPYIKQSTLHSKSDLSQFEVTTSGPGDLQLLTQVNLSRSRDVHFSVNFGLSLPTGSIDERATTPRGPNTQLPYTMQLGSGTFDIDSGFNFALQRNKWIWGMMLQGKIRSGRNDHDYKLGNGAYFTTWLLCDRTSWLAPSLQVNINYWQQISGGDRGLDPTVVLMGDARNYGGLRIDLVFSSHIFNKERDGLGNRLGFDIGLPVYQTLNGPQLANTARFSLAWQYSFR